MVLGAEGIWIAFDRWEESMQAVDWAKQSLKKFPIRVIHNSIYINTHTNKMVLIHSTKENIH